MMKNDMKTTKLYDWILGLVLLIFLVENGIILCNIRKTDREHNEVLPQMQELVEYKTKSEINIQTLLGYLDTDGLMLGNVGIRNAREAGGRDASDTIARPLSAWLNRDKIIFRFFQFSCTSCVTEQLALLDEVAEKVGRENIILLTDALQGQIDKYMRQKEIALPVYRMDAEAVLLPCDKELLPYLLYVDSRGKVLTSVMLSPDTKQYGKAFYRSVVRRMEKRPAVVVETYER